MSKSARNLLALLLMNSFCAAILPACFAQTEQPALRGPIDSSNDKNAPAANSSKKQDQSLIDGIPPLPPPGVSQMPAKLDKESDPNVLSDPTKGPSNVSIPMHIVIPGSFDDGAKKKPKEPLSGLIGTSVDMKTDPQELAFGPYRGLNVRVHNGSDRPLIFNGDKTVIRFGTQVVQPITVRQVDVQACPPLTRGEKVVAVLKSAVTVGAVNAIGDEEVQKGPILGRYGCDERRRESEQNRFGRRILWPGDDSEGIVFFETEQSLKGGSIEMPVSTIFTNDDNNALTNVGPLPVLESPAGGGMFFNQPR